MNDKLIICDWGGVVESHNHYKYSFEVGINNI